MLVMFDPSAFPSARFPLPSIDAIVDTNNTLLGIYTDGDLRRTLSEKISIDTPISQVMTADPVTAEPTTLAAELISLMKDKSISGLMVTDDSGVVGALNMQDLLRAGIL